MKITIQYFDGCRYWKLAYERVRLTIEGLSPTDVALDYQWIDSPEMAERVGFRGSPTILVDGRDPFATGTEPIGMSCRVFRTEDGIQGAPSEVQLRTVFGANRQI